jgi:DNA-binding transcriptional MerR regulator
MDKTDKAYTPKEVNSLLDVSESTARKWCISLEKKGYMFIRNDRNQRLFTEHDLVALKKFQTLLKETNMPMDNAADIIISRFGKGTFEDRTLSVPEEFNEERRSLERSEETIEKLMKHIQTQEEYMKKQDEFNQSLLKRLDQQEKYILSRLEERDKSLTDSLREMQQTQKLIAAAQEEKKSFFAKLFGK